MIPPGLEPGTSRLGILRSILMSYRTTGVSYYMGVDWGRWNVGDGIYKMYMACDEANPTMYLNKLLSV